MAKPVDQLRGLIVNSQVGFVVHDNPSNLALGAGATIFGSQSYSLNFARTTIHVPLPLAGMQFVLSSRQNNRRFAAQTLHDFKRSERVRLSTKFNRNFNLYVPHSMREQARALFTEQVQAALLYGLDNCDITTADDMLEIHIYARLYPKNVARQLHALGSLMQALRPVLQTMPQIPEPSETIAQYNSFYTFFPHA